MKDFFGKNADSVINKKLFLFDMDGTIYRENELFDGALDLLQSIKNSGARYVFITNNSSKSLDAYIEKINKMGIMADAENFFTSVQASVMLLKDKHDGELVYAQGTKSFIDELIKSGIKVTTEFDERAKVVIVGFDTELTGEKLRATSKMLTLLDVDYYATNPDWVCPVDFGFIPDCGSMCFGLEKATGKAPVYIGKPKPMMIEKVMQKFGVQKEETLVIGDRIYTDILSGVNAGVETVCVLSGEVSLKDVIDSEVKPTYVFESVKDMIF